MGRGRVIRVMHLDTPNRLKQEKEEKNNEGQVSQLER